MSEFHSENLSLTYLCRQSLPELVVYAVRVVRQKLLLGFCYLPRVIGVTHTHPGDPGLGTKRETLSGRNVSGISVSISDSDFGGTWQYLYYYLAETDETWLFHE
jgi:hypothetical protein